MPEESLDDAFAHLNREQREAVDALDGPVLVVAGPGTGKTQLLSLRAANILKNRDVAARNLLCLTYTDAGALAMRKRLVDFIGSAAYGINVATFHGFAQSLRQSYPQYFARGALSAQISDLKAIEQQNALLNALPVTDPLYQPPRDGVHGALADLRAFIGQFKRSGLKPEEFEAITEQSLGFMRHVADNSELLELLQVPLNKGSRQEKREHIDRIAAAVANAAASAPSELVRPLVKTPGIYRPYAAYLASEFSGCELYDDESGKTTGFRDLRDRLFKKSGDGSWSFKDEQVCQRTLRAIELCRSYQAYLAEQDLYDYDDMILDAIAAIEASTDFQALLEEQYLYIQVDEYQDTNGAQMRLVDLIAGNNPSPNVLAVGDDDQAIMRFQGASVAYINQFEQHYQGVRRCVLKTNYRSTPSLVELGQQVARQIEYRSEASKTEKALVAHLNEGAPQHFMAQAYPTKDLQYHACAKAISERIDAGFVSSSKRPDEAIAVIAPVHATLRSIIPYLKAEGVPFNYTYTSTVSQSASLMSLFAVLRFASEQAQARPDHADAHLPQILAAPELGLKPESFIGLALEARRSRLNWFDAMAASKDESVLKLHSWLSGLVAMALSAPVRHTIAEAARPMAEYYQSHAADDQFAPIEFNYGLRALLAFVEGEMGLSPLGEAKQPLRLPGLIGCFAQAERFGVNVDSSLPVGRSGAVTLTTAHSSKGLEFDLVYMLDSSDKVWHPAAKSNRLLPKNLLFNTEKDDDDIRRLLFVALTRARYELELMCDANGLVRELADFVVEKPAEPTLEEVAEEAESGWRDAYRLDGEEIAALAQADLAAMRMSASRLNAFVEYQEGCANSAEFLTRDLLRLPEPPSAILAFGTVAHMFMEDYLNHVLKAEDISLEALSERFHNYIDGLDFEESELSHMHQRLEHVTAQFIPKLSEYITGTTLAERWVQADIDGIPLTGKCDLLVLDEASRSITVFDFKTSSKLPDKRPSTAYLRQLQFYRLLLENSEEFKGWTVTASADLFVEPMRDLGYQLFEPQFFSASDAELEHLARLIRAVWQRIQSGELDTSAFESSQQLADVVQSSTKADGTPKRPDKRDIQSAYEQWLIADYESNRV